MQLKNEEQVSVLLEHDNRVEVDSKNSNMVG